MVSRERETYLKKWREKNKDKLKDICRKYRESEQGKKVRKEYYLDNKEKISKWHKEDYIKNKEEITVRNKNYHLDNPQVMERASKKYKHNNPSRVLEIAKKYRQNNPDKVRISKRNWGNNNPGKVKKMKKRQYEKKVNIENIRRKEQGLPLIGETKLYNETKLFVILKSMFPDLSINIHDKNELKGLELDAFIPELKLAFEYQGEQHFEKNIGKCLFIRTPEDFELQKFRDERKKELCKEKGIILVHINYNEKLSKELILRKLKEANIETVMFNGNKG